MKIRYPVIAIVVILIIEINFRMVLPFELSETLGILLLVCLGLIVYLIIRNIFRAIRGAATGGQSKDYAAEARRACETVTPKQKQKGE